MIPYKPMQLYRQTPRLDQVKYPTYVSPKLDGIRCLLYSGKAYSRNGKLIPNKHIQQTLRQMHLPELDGELMIAGDFNSVQSAVMSVHGTPDFTYNIFDIIMPTRLSFDKRLYIISRLADDKILKLVPQILVNSPEELEAAWSEFEDDGFEGAVTKNPNSFYKHGRSTLRENTAFKFKRMHDDEGTVTAYKELMHNSDTSTKKLENQVPGNCLGALEIKWGGVYFDLGSGFDLAERHRLWHIRDSLLGKKVTFKYQGTGPNGKPRFPVFKAFRED